MKTSIQPITFWNETATTLVIENANITTFGEGGTVHIQWYVSTNEGKRLKNDVIFINKLLCQNAKRNQPPKQHVLFRCSRVLRNTFRFRI